MKPRARKRNSSRRNGYKKYLRTIRDHWDTIEKRYKVKEIGIFRSYARGEQRKRSDVDILVDFDEVPDLHTFMGLADYLEGILKKKVDLVRKPVIRKELREQVFNEVVYV